MLVGCRQALFLGGAPGAAVGRVHLPLLGPVPSKRPPNVSSVTPPARGGPVTASPSARRSRPSRRRASRRARCTPSSAATTSLPARCGDSLPFTCRLGPVDTRIPKDVVMTRFAIETSVRPRERTGPSRGRGPEVHPGELVLPRGSNVRDKGVAKRGPRAFSRRARDRPEPVHPADADPKFTRVYLCFPGEAMFAIKVSPREARARSSVERVTGPSRPIPRARTRSSPG